MDKEVRSKNTDRWSEDGQIFFHYGKGYGLTKRLQTVCRGTEEEIKKQFAEANQCAVRAKGF